MIPDWKHIFKKFTPLELASIELTLAETELLASMTHRDHANGMVTYNEARIARLRKFIVTAAKAETQPKSNVQALTTT